MIAADLRKRRPKPHTTWHLDEVYLNILEKEFARGDTTKKTPGPRSVPRSDGATLFPKTSAEIATNRRNADCPRFA